MNRKILTTAGIFGITAIILGAFGAHTLKQFLTSEQLTSFETGVRYQMYHAFFLLFLGITDVIEIKTKKTIAILTVLGTSFFSGSIYLLSTMSISNINFKPIGIMTPIGGTLLIVAWGVLTIHFSKKKI